MYKHILVPTDGSPLSAKAARAAADLAAKTGARITALHAIAPLATPLYPEALIYDPGLTNEGYEQHMRAHADKLLGKVKAEAASRQVACDTVTVVDGRPWDAIVKASHDHKCDLIVMASHGRSGLEGLLLGSETTKVLTHSKTPVLVCR